MASTHESAGDSAQAEANLAEVISASWHLCGGHWLLKDALSEVEQEKLDTTRRTLQACVDEHVGDCAGPC